MVFWQCIMLWNIIYDFSKSVTMIEYYVKNNGAW